MAQRTGAERFLAPPAKSASAGVALALALAALLLSGCGGGSSDPETQAAAEGTTAAAGPDQGSEAAKGKAKQPRAAKADSKASGAEGADGTGSAKQPPTHKQGPRIAQPKGAEERAPTPAELANATVADISLESPAIVASGGNPGSLSPVYTCDGKDSWPALSWSGVPAGSAELILYVMNVQPVAGELFVDWAVAGLDPALSSIEAGELPKGAVLATNGFGKRGYSICPAGQGEIYMFVLYALPRRLSPPKGFDARLLRPQILDVSTNAGLLPALYAHS